MPAVSKVVLVDDHSVVRAGLKALLDLEPDIEIIGEFGDAKLACKHTYTHKPNLVLMDLSMPYLNGTEAIEIIKQRCPDTRILVLTVHKQEEYLRVALKAGAHGYAVKDDDYDELIMGIRIVLNGKTYISPSVSDHIVSVYLNKTAAIQDDNYSLSSWERLTHREREVAKLVAEGLKNREIAGFLSISYKTVEKHRSNIMKKLNLNGIPALVSYAIENGIVI
jgi:DNA-binding NarL/FixJ family response regulator